jgi:hypothetical protein
MLTVSTRRSSTPKKFRGWLLLMNVIVVSLTADLSAILSALFKLTWKPALLTVLASVLIACGALFTIANIHETLTRAANPEEGDAPGDEDELSLADSGSALLVERETSRASARVPYQHDVHKYA